MRALVGPPPDTPAEYPMVIGSSRTGKNQNERPYAPKNANADTFEGVGERYGNSSKMEARGFEPRSEKRLTTASTCVFH
jgi:hypothetical protein